MSHLKLLLFALVAPTPALGQARLPVGPETDRQIAVTLSPLFTIGGADAERVELTTIYPRDVAGTADGRVTFLDRTDSRVVTVGKTGRVEWVAGRKGQGPGELRVPGFVISDPDGFVSVWDNGRGTLLNFDQAGKLHSEVRMPDVGLAQGMRHRGLGDVMVAQSRGERMSLLDRRGEVSVEVASRTNLPSRRVPTPECEITDYPVRPIFAPDFLWDHGHGLNVINLDGSFAMEFRDASGRAWVASRRKGGRPSTPALAREQVGAGPNVSVAGGRPCRIPASRILATAEVLPTVPAYSRLVIAPDTTVWAVRYSVGSEPRQADLYSPRTGYLGTVALRAADPIGFRTDGAMISLEVDDDEIPRIVVYSVRVNR
jgi:hypothetical protein